MDINPKFSQALNNVAVVYTIQGKLGDAFAHLKGALSIDPNYAEAYNNIGVLYRDEGRIQRAIMCYEQCLELNPLSTDAGQNRLLALNYVPSRVPDKIFLAHQAWGKQQMERITPFRSWQVCA